jgi:small-conductance mechanosensitive channel
LKIIKAHPVLSSTNKNIGSEPMKEIRISFTISIPLKQTDIHWIEEELLKKREEVFMEVMKEVIK